MSVHKETPPSKDDRCDSAPPGREKQVQALKEKPGIDNPYAVAWASYEGDAYDSGTWMGAKCDACGGIVPVTDDGKIDKHLAPIPGGSYGEGSASATRGDASEHPMICPGSGAETHMDHIEHRGGKWVLLSKTTGKVLGEHATKEEAEAQERAVQASKHSDAAIVRRFERYDFAQDLPQAQVTADGFLAVAGRVARTGIQEYRDGQGGVRRELRLPDDVRASLPSFALQPLTNTHPAEMVDPDNAKKYVVGAVGEAVMNADGWVRAPLKIYSADGIAAARGGRVQLSVGYTCRLDATPGEWQGQKYDAVQRDIVVNHVAMVDVARAGAGARMRLDGSDAEALVSDASGVLTIKGRTEKMMAHELKVDGFKFEVSDGNAQAIVDRAIDAVRKDGEVKLAAAAAARETAEKAATDARANLAEVTKKADAAQAQADAHKSALESALAETIKMDGAEISLADFRDATKRDAFLQAAIDKRAAARTALVVEARKHLGANEVFDAHTDKAGKVIPAKSDLEIKKLVVLKLDAKAQLEGKSADYVQARYDAVVEQATKKTPTAIDVVRSVNAPVVPPVHEDGAQGMDPDAARRAMIQRTLDANVKAKRN